MSAEASISTRLVKGSDLVVGKRVRVVGSLHPVIEAVAEKWLGRVGEISVAPDSSGYLFVRFAGVYDALHHVSEVEPEERPE